MMDNRVAMTIDEACEYLLVYGFVSWHCVHYLTKNPTSRFNVTKNEGLVLRKRGRFSASEIIKVVDEVKRIGML